MFGFAPALSSVLIESTSFFVTANTSGVKPLFDTALTSVPLGGRPHERGLVSKRFGHIDVGAVERQLLHSVEVPGSCGDHQGRLAIPAGCPRIGACGEKLVNERRVGVCGGERERRLSVFV